MNSWVDHGQNLLVNSRIFAALKENKIYSTMSETKAAIAERTIRSLKNILYRYMEDYGHKYSHKLPQFIAKMNSGNNRIIDVKPNHVKISDFMPILYSKPLREYKNPNLEWR